MDEDTTSLAERVVSLARDLILIPSTHGQPDDRARGFTFLRNHLEAVPGIALREFQSNGFDSLVATAAGCENPRIMLIGHLDVIEHADLRVYRSRVVGDRLFGPGAGDMKGSLALMLDLFLALHRARPGIPLGLTVTSDEERGGVDGVRYLFEEMGLRCGLAIIPDGGSLNEVTVAEKGVVHADLVAAGREGHAARPWLVANAADRLIRALRRISDAFPDRPAAATEDNAHWHDTCVVTSLHTTNTTPNCIPDDARATLDLRFIPPATANDVLDRLRDAAGPDVHVAARVAANPTHLRPDPLWAEIAEQVTGEPVRMVKSSGGSDGRFLCALGIPVILSRPLVGDLHGENEWIDIPSMLEFREIARRFVLERLAAGASPPNDRNDRNDR